MVKAGKKADKEIMTSLFIISRIFLYYLHYLDDMYTNGQQDATTVS
jgi:hypothetical protein